MRAAADILEDELDGLGACMTLEMGKPIAQSRAEALKCAKAMRFYADNAEGFLADERSPTRRRSAPPAAVHALRAARRRAGRHAVELPALAGHPLRRTCPDGGQRGPAQARVERAAVRPLPRHPLRARRLPRGVASGHCSSAPARRGGPAGPAGGGRHAHRHREPAGRSVASIAGDEVKKTVLELGGSRSVHRACRSADLDRAAATAVTVADAEQRAVLHRRQALHRPPGRVRRVRASASPRPCGR